jgi:hypothetical protein
LLFLPIQVLFICPQFAHLFGDNKQVVEGALRIDLSVFEDDDMVGPAKYRSSMGDDEIGLLTVREKSFPKCAF